MFWTENDLRAAIIVLIVLAASVGAGIAAAAFFAARSLGWW